MARADAVIVCSLPLAKMPCIRLLGFYTFFVSSCLDRRHRDYAARRAEARTHAYLHNVYTDEPKIDTTKWDRSALQLPNFAERQRQFQIHVYGF